jgi:hypothetical protein
MKTEEAVECLMEVIDNDVFNEFTVGGSFEKLGVGLALPGLEITAKDGDVFQVIVVKKH